MSTGEHIGILTLKSLDIERVAVAADLLYTLCGLKGSQLNS